MTLSVSVEAVLDDAALLARLKPRFSEAAQVLGRAVCEDCGPYVPYDTGALFESGHVGEVYASEDSLIAPVIWDVPYAASVYYGDRCGVRYSTEHHVHARARWSEGARIGGAARWQECVRAVLDGA